LGEGEEREKGIGRERWRRRSEEERKEEEGEERRERTLSIFVSFSRIVIISRF
jgi:hypothetical protein